MKKILGVVFAALLVFSMSGQALASFDAGSFLVMTYGSDVEQATNMGMDPAATVQVSNLYNTDLSLFTGASTFADLSIGAFATSVSGSMLERYDVYFAVAEGDAPTIRPANIYSVTGAGDNIYANFDNSGSQSTGAPAGYVTKMNDSGISEGYYANFNDQSLADGFVNLAALDAGAGSFVEMDIYHFYSDDWGASINTDGIVGSLTYGLNDSCEVYADLNVNAVPIPGSVLLLGSGLLGLFGIRRKKNA